MATTPAFEKAYGELNERQKEAVDAIYGPVLVIAGPGTGKTQMLAVRIGNILQKATGAKPDEILALTYTESAVAALRKRLLGLIGAAAYRVRIHTFHGFARSILELRPDLFPRVGGGTQLSEVRGIELMERLLDQGSYTKIRSAKHPYRAAKDLLSFMGKLKQERYTPDAYRLELAQQHAALMEDPERMHEKGKYAGQEKGEYLRRRERIEKHLEAADLFAAYEKALEQHGLYDYEDLILEAVNGLASNDAFRAEVAERSQFVLADEHQDANPAQNRLLELVTDIDGAPNLFIVGDEKQAIYRFQGASLASFFYFKDTYPDLNVISLERNYRSTSQILAAAHDLIAPAPVPDPSLRPVLISERGTGSTIRSIECDTPKEEYEAILAAIQEWHHAGAAYEDIAILTKKNADVLALAEFLRSNGIPEDHKSVEITALAHPAVLLFISLVRAAANLREDAHLARALFMPGAPLTLTQRMQVLASPREGTLFNALLRNDHEELRAWARKLATLSEEMPATPLVSWLTRLAHESGFVNGVLGLGESEDAYEAYQGLMDEAALTAQENPSATATDFLRHLSLIETHELRVKRARTSRKGVALMTAHGAKGLEFPYVIIAHATDERWMRGKSDEFSLLIEKEEDEHDVRRLLYVALTRAKQEVLITRSTVTAEDREQSPLRFLADISSHLEAAVPLSATRTPAPYGLRTVLDPVFLTDRLLAQGFSPTSFNNFTASPWQYYFRNLLRLPDAPTLPLLFGTAVHAGLKAYADGLKQGTTTTIEDALRGFRNELLRLPLTPQDRATLSQTGENALRAYLAQEGASMKHARESEFAVTTVITVPGLGEVPLSGKIDRLDIKEDGSVEVIDYKTGKARSENEIRGLTKTGTGDYYRQLVFYKLLLRKDGRYSMDRGVLHFVEPDEKGKVITRSFSITDAETDELQRQLIEAAQHIADGSAFNAACDPDVCDYCDLVGFLTVP